MDWETFRIKRAQIALQIYEHLEANPPKGVLEVHSPDSIGATGLKFEDGYILIQVEDAS
jgi:hypothetical protein